MAEMKKINIVKSSFVVMSMIMLSRILGMIRTLAIAYFFGAGAVTDAFYSALQISNLLRQLLGEGALGTAFIPIYNERVKKDGEKAARELIFLTLNFLFVFLLITSLIMLFCSHWITEVIVFGYPEQTKLLVTHLLKIMSFYLFFVGLSGMICAVLNNYGQFLLPATTSIFYNLVTIAAMFFFAKKFAIDAMAWGVLVAGILQLVVVIPSLLKITKGYRLVFSLTNKYMMRIFKLVLPRLAGVFSLQLNLTVDQFFGSFLAVGSISALNNASYLYNLPLGMFGVAIGTVIFPSISRHAENKRWRNVKMEIEKGLTLLTILVVPCMVASVIFSHDIVMVVFGHRGHFTNGDDILTAQALWVYSIGLFSFTAVQILSRAFYAMKNTKDPVKYAVLSILLNTLFCAIFVHFFAIKGIALATVLASFINFAQLYYWYNRKYIKLNGKKLLRFFMTILIVCILIAVPLQLFIHHNLEVLILFTLLYFIVLFLIYYLFDRNSLNRAMKRVPILKNKF